MVNRRLIAGIGLILVMVFLLACGPKAAPAPSPQAPAPKATPQAPVAPTGAAAPAASAKPAWQEKWETVLAAAKKEGKVVMFNTGGAETRRAIAKGFKDAFGMDAEVIAGKGAEFRTKLFAERRAGLYNYDLWMGGTTGVLQIDKPGGAVTSFDDALILPDVTDPKYWYQGKLPWVDKDHTVFILALLPRPAIAINTNLVKPDEMKSWRNVLDPKWRGKVVINDPSVVGAGQQAIGALDALMGEDYLRELVKTNPIIVRDERLIIDWLVHGKVAIAIPVEEENFIEQMKVGAPIMTVIPAEGIYLSSASSGLSVYNPRPHPNAATVLINWIASKEGLEIYARAAMVHSTRIDVPTSHLLPHQIRQPTVKYYDASTEEASTVRIEKTQKLIKEIFVPLIGK